MDSPSEDNDFPLTITRREFNALRYELFALKEIVKGLCQIVHKQHDVLIFVQTDLTNLATNFPTWLLELEKKEDIVSQVTRMQETLKRWTVPVEALLVNFEQLQQQQQLDALKQQQPQQQPLLPQRQPHLQQELQQQPQPQQSPPIPLQESGKPWPEVVAETLIDLKALRFLTLRERKDLNNYAMQLYESAFSIIPSMTPTEEIKLPQSLWLAMMEEFERRARSKSFEHLTFEDLKACAARAVSPVSTKRSRTETEAFEPLSKRTRSRSTGRTPPESQRISVSERPATRQRSVSRRRTDIGKITVVERDDWTIRISSRSRSRERSEADSGGLKSFSRSRSQWDKTMPSPDKDSGQLSPSRGRIHPDRAFIVDDSRGRSRFNRSVSRGRRTSTHTERNTSIPRGTAPVFAADATSARAGELRPPHKVCYECKVRSSPRWIDGIKDGVAVLFCIRCHRKMGRGSRGISMSRVEYDHDQGARGRSKSRTRL